MKVLTRPCFGSGTQLFLGTCLKSFMGVMKFLTVVSTASLSVTPVIGNARLQKTKKQTKNNQQNNNNNKINTHTPHPPQNHEKPALTNTCLE